MILRPLPTQPEVLDAWISHDILSLADWAEDRYILPKETAELAGPWSNDYVPYLMDPMQWLSDMVTRQVTICACTQSGKTELSNILIGRTIDVNPAPTMIVMPREDDVNRRLATRIRPMFKSQPSLLHHLGGKLDKLNIGKETILDNMILYLAWSNSPAAMSDNPVCIVILDEAAKFPPSTGREADPYSLTKKRQRTFRTRSKLLIMSSPVGEGDLFDAEFQKGDKNEWFARCPCCGIYHIMKQVNLKIDKDKAGNWLDAEIYRAGGHARYVCPACKKPWDEYQRWDAISSGRYAPADCSVDPSRRIVGNIPITSHHSCRITALMLHPAFQTMDDLAGDWAAAIFAKKTGNVKPLQDYINSQLAEPWKEAEQKTDIDVIRPHIGDLESGIVPEGVQLLTGGVDVQADHVWVVILGWGYLSECRLIYAGRIETGDTRDLANYGLVRTFAAYKWPLARDEKIVMRTAATAVDCGYHTDTVIDFCRQCTESNLIAVRGDDKVKTRVYHAFKLPDGKSVRYDLNVTILKDRLYRLLFESTTPGPGYFHLPCDVTEEILGHFTSEEKRVVRGRYRQELRWVLKDSGKPNHIWDASVYATFAAELAGARLLAGSEQRPAKPLKIIGKPVKYSKIRTKY